jgi:hypothetical protein
MLINEGRYGNYLTRIPYTLYKDAIKTTRAHMHSLLGHRIGADLNSLSQNQIRCLCFKSLMFSLCLSN